MSFQRLILETSKSAAQFKSVCDLASDKRVGAVNLASYFEALAGGVYSSNVKVAVGVVKATGSVTFTGLPTAAETLSIANVTFTAIASGATGNQFNIGADATATATNLVTAINASSDVNKIVLASSAAGVVTLTSLIPGEIGNAIELSEALTNATATAFASGAEGTEYELDLD